MDWKVFLGLFYIYRLLLTDGLLKIRMDAGLLVGSLFFWLLLLANVAKVGWISHVDISWNSSLSTKARPISSRYRL